MMIIMPLSVQGSRRGFLALDQRIFVPKKARRLHDERLAEIKTRAGTANRGPEASGR
jgi:hypothetical protein